MRNERVQCSADGCSEELQMTLDPNPSGEASVYDRQRAVIARNHGWVMGHHADTGAIRQYCPVHGSETIAGFAPF